MVLGRNVRSQGSAATLDQAASRTDHANLIQQLVNSLSVASVTILIGIGITLIFGLAGIVNFAHGEFLMVGGMVTWFLVSAG